MTVTMLIVGLIAALAASAFFSGAETGAYTVNPIRLRVRGNQGGVREQRLAGLLRERQDLITVALVGTNIANYITTLFTAMLITDLAADLTSGEVEMLTTVMLTPVVFVFGEVLPKNVFRISADTLMPRASLALSVCSRAFHVVGIIPLLGWMTDRLLRLWVQQSPPSYSPRGEVLALLKEGVAHGVITDQQSELVDRVLALGTISVGAAMVPRSRVITLARGTSRQEVLETIREHPHTRYPVVDADPRRAIGVLDAYEYLLTDAPTIDGALYEGIRLEAGASVAAALRRMRERKQTFGIVVDRWDNCIGVVTVKDLVEEIVGELHAW